MNDGKHDLAALPRRAATKRTRLPGGHSRAFILLDSFKEDAEWLKKMLDGPAREHLLELIKIHDELDGLVGYESFHDGFILGARLMMEVACGQSRFSDGD